MDAGSFVCRDRIMVRPPAGQQRSKIVIASSGSSEIQVVEILVGTSEYPRGSLAAVESQALGDGGRKSFLGQDVIVVPLSHVLAVSPPAAK